MNKNKITPEQEKIIDTIHNLVWHRITHDDKYLNAIPEIDSKNLHDWIYHASYQMFEADDSQIDAIVCLNDRHYHYVNTPQFLNQIWVNEIDEDKVKDKIVEIGGEIYEGFELYNHIETGNDSEINKKMESLKSGKFDKKDELSEGEYYDLPF